METNPKNHLAIAGGAITLSLMDTLVRRGILNRGDGLAVLDTARKQCATLSAEAAELVGQLHAKMSRGD